MTTILRSFLAMSPERQCLYLIGRRLGIFFCLSDMQEPHKLTKVEQACRELGATPANVDEMTTRLTKRFI
jgi:membrane protein DedA with SNARE-associated domain